MSETKDQIASTILKQIGGNRFLVMTGSHTLVSNRTNKSLSMKLRRNKSRANFLTISVNAMDTYDMLFISYKVNSKTQELKMDTIKELKGIYNDQLEAMFTDVTGLYTSL
jgi:hypothetical protein